MHPFHKDPDAAADFRRVVVGNKAEQRTLDAGRLVFLDETGTATNMARRYGRSPRGERLNAEVPHGHWMMTTFIAGLRVDGLTAPLVIDAPMNGVIFLAYIEQFLAPTLGPVLSGSRLGAVAAVTGVAL